MKLRKLFVGLIAMTALFIGCQEKPVDLGAPSITLDPLELAFAKEGETKSITLTATRDWKVEDIPEWLALNKDSGKASAEAQTIEVTAQANTGLDREASVKVTIGMVSKFLTVTQAGSQGSPDALVIYSNDFDKAVAEKTYGSSGNSWPYLDQFDGWQNAKGTGIEGHDYSFKGVSVRANSASNGQHSDYPGSGNNNIFFGSGAYFSVNKITLGSASNIEISFGASKYSQDASIGSTFKNSEVHLWLSQDGTKWVDAPYTFAGTAEGKWNVASGTYKVTGTEKLYVCIQIDIASVYRIDDLKILATDVQGETVNFANGVNKDFGTTGGGDGDDIPAGTGEGTEASPYSASKAYHVANALADGQTVTGKYVSGKIKEIKEVNLQYKNATYYITDADGIVSFYVYRGKYLNGADFTAEDQIKVGDEVVLYGDLMNYKGNSPQLAQGNKIVKLNEGTGEGEGDGDTAPEIPATLTSIADFLAASVGDTWYKVKGQITNIASTDWGNLTVQDETGSLYVYGLTKEYAATNDKSFASIGLKAGYYVTFVAKRGEYNGNPQAVGAFYISHEEGQLDVGENVNFTKITSAPANWAGKYLIYMDDQKAHAAVSGKDFVAVSDVLTDNGGVISAPEGYAVTIEANGDKWAIKLPDGKYLGLAHNSAAASDTPVAFDLEYTDAGVKISGIVSDKPYYLYYNKSNSTNHYIRFYVDKGTSAVYVLPLLYKK